MKRFLVALFLLISGPAAAQIPGPAGVVINQTPVQGGTSSNCLYITSANKVGQQACGSGSAAAITVGTTAISGGATTRILYNNAGALGEYTLSGSGTVVAMANSPSFTTPTLGVATATSVSVALTALTAPSMFGTDNTTGLTFPATGQVGITVGGAGRWLATATGLRGGRDIILGWASSAAANTTADTSLSRVAAGVIGCGTGAAASVAGQCYGATIRTGQTTFAGLPAAATAGAGARAFITDAATCTFAAAVTGGGAVACPVYSDGAAWLGG